MSVWFDNVAILSIACSPNKSFKTPALSAVFNPFIFSKTFRIVPSASFAISCATWSPLSPKNSKALAFLLVSAPFPSSKYNCFIPVAATSGCFPIDISVAPKAMLASLAIPIVLATPPTLFEKSTN